jgi:hypothetical protein
MTDLRIEPLSTDNAAAAGAVLSASHHNYPAFRVEFPNPRVRRRVLLPFQTAAARDVAVYGSLLGAYLAMTPLVSHCGNHLAGFH